MHVRLRSALLASTCCLSIALAFAQNAAPQAPAETQAKKQEGAWQLLLDNVHDEKHPDIRTQALSALSDLGVNSKANDLIAGAMKDPDLDVRSAAVLAAGKTKSRALVPPLHKLLDDPEPQVVYTAATVLWKDFGDKSGEDILDSIVSGDRKANPTLIHGAQHQMSKTMHSPSSMAKIGLTQGAGLLLGPFGFSVTAIEYMRRNGSDNARIESLDLLAQEKTPGVRDDLMDALTDKDPGMRAAAVRALGQYHEQKYATAIEPLMHDDKLPVRLTASAAYLNSLSHAAHPSTKK